MARMVLSGPALPVPAAAGLSGSLESSAVRHPAVIAAAAALGAIVLAGCGSEGVVTPTPNTVVGTLPQAKQLPIVPATASRATRRRAARCSRARAAEAAIRSPPRTPPARSGRTSTSSSPLPHRHVAGDERRQRDACVQVDAQHEADRGRGRLRRDLDRRHRAVELPAAFPAHVAAFAFDLDRTLIAEDGVLRRAHPGSARADEGNPAHVVVVTGRMFRAVRPYLEQARARRSRRLLPGRRRRRPGDG